MQSLAEECTPLKQRYDSCFNLWFEGYLQPALDGVVRAPAPAPAPAPSPPTTSTTTSTPPSPPSLADASADPNTTAKPKPPRLITSWANSSVFRTRPARIQHSADDMVATEHVHWEKIVGEDEEDLPPLDTSGMTRAQAKAAEYERSCGKVWKEYQGCLRKAVAQNENLTQLLDQAREEHPLHSMDGLEGSPWDPQSNPK